MLRSLPALGLLAAFAPAAFAQVVINEFQYDDQAVDDFEYVELYNAGGVPVDISGWRIVNRDGGSPLYGGAGTDPTHVIPATTILNPGAFYVLGNVAVPNVNQVLPANSLENDNESIELWTAANVLVDSVCYEMGQGAFGNTFPSFPLEGNGLYGDLATGNLTSSIGRIFDGYDTNRNSVDFACSMVCTPGTTNNEANALPLVDNFDSGPLLGTIPAWSRGFINARYIDPTTVDAQNVQAKPASPQGGQAMSMWDNSGGGNAVQLIGAPVADVVLECYAYFWPTMTPLNPVTSPYTVVAGQYNVGDGEYWAVGVRGTVAANANPPDVSGTYYNDIALGVGFRPHSITGLAWLHYRTPTYSRLWLVDLKDGAQAPVSPNPPNLNFTVLGGPIDIVAGVNDGWQRIRLHVQGNVVVANFGGNYGFDDGVRFATTTSTLDPGKIYIAYREAVLSTQAQQPGPHPPNFDALDIHVPTTSKSFFGLGSPLANSVIPQIDANGLPIVGSTGFAIKGSSLVPSGFNYLAISLNPFAPGFQIPSAPPGAFAFLLSIDFEFFLFSDGSGNASQTIPIPPNLAFVGTPFDTQMASFDPGLLAYALPIGITQPMLMTLGN